jgi:hypothetical protein
MLVEFYAREIIAQRKNNDTEMTYEGGESDSDEKH